MTRFNTTTPAKPAVTSPIKSKTATPDTKTYNQGAGYTRDAKSEVFLLGVANMFGTDTYYEKGKDRDDRFKALIRSLALSEPVWTAQFLSWLRASANMRTISLVGAAEFVKARLDYKTLSSNPAIAFGEGDGLNRQVIASVLLRPDEPGEFLAYWIANHGRKIPKPVKRGVADAAVRMYSERNLLKYDTGSHGVRFGDVIELTHAKPKAPWQGWLFKSAIDRRHNRDEWVHQDLHMVATNAALREAWKLGNYTYDNTALTAAGMTWEDVLSGLGDKVSKKDLWTSLIPTMGLMAQIRNLRNFDQAGVTDEAIKPILDKLADPGAVVMSRQFPFRFLSAYLHAPSLRWSYPLEQALNWSVANVPALPGRTLILVDQSGSMSSKAAGSLSDMTNAQVATIFASALALRAESVTLVEYDDHAKEIPVTSGGSVLRLIQQFQGPRGGTDTWGTFDRFFKGHDRVIILTDEQADPANAYKMYENGRYTYGRLNRFTPPDVPIYTWNLAGYRMGHTPSGSGKWHTMGGLTDQAWRIIPMLEAGHNGTWPWETNG